MLLVSASEVADLLWGRLPLPVAALLVRKSLNEFIQIKVCDKQIHTNDIYIYIYIYNNNDNKNKNSNNNKKIIIIIIIMISSNNWKEESMLKANLSAIRQRNAKYCELLFPTACRISLLTNEIGTPDPQLEPLMTTLEKCNTD